MIMETFHRKYIFDGFRDLEALEYEMHAESLDTQIIENTLQKRHNERDGISNHRRLDCFVNRLFRHRSKKTLKPRVTGLCEGNSPVIREFPHKGPKARKMVPFDDVITIAKIYLRNRIHSHSLRCQFWKHGGINSLSILNELSNLIRNTRNRK